MKTGLVLEGGAMRGMFTAGVIDVLMENKISTDGAVGVSAGAVFGCNYKSGQIGRVIRYNKRYCRDKRYCSFYSLVTTGDMYGAEFCYNELPYKLDVFDIDAYNSNPCEFFVVCTDVNTGLPVYRSCPTADFAFMEWLRASASMPLLSRIVDIDGYRLLDGGIADSIPIRFFETAGYDKNIVVLTQPDGYVKPKNSLMPLLKAALHKYPNLLTALENRHINYNNTLSYIKEKELKGELLVIRPKAPLGIGKTEKNPEKLQQVYELGRAAANSRLDEIKSFLQNEITV